MSYGSSRSQFSKEGGRHIEDCKLRVILVTPSDYPSLLQVNESFKREVSFKESHFQNPNHNEPTSLMQSPLRNPEGLEPSVINGHMDVNGVKETSVQNGDELKVPQTNVIYLAIFKFPC